MNVKACIFQNEPGLLRRMQKPSQLGVRSSVKMKYLYVCLFKSDSQRHTAATGINTDAASDRHSLPLSWAASAMSRVFSTPRC